MTPQALASKLTVWSKRKISYDLALVHATNYFAGTLNDGLIKDYFIIVYPLLVPCKIPTCAGTTNGIYCQDCLDMTPSSAITKLLKDIGEFLCGRRSA